MPDLKIMYPVKEVKLSYGRVVKMRPIPIRELPTVLFSFIKVAGELENGKSVSELMAEVSDDLLSLLGLCLEGVTVDELTMADCPLLLGIMIDQNLDEATIKNWSGLLSRFQKLNPMEAQAEPQKSVKKNLKKS